MKLFKINLFVILSVIIVTNLFCQNKYFQIDENILFDSTVNINGYFIESVYPQPFGYITEYKFGIPDSSNVNITIISSSKDTVINLFDGILGNGYYKVIWDRFDKNKLKVTSGIYYLFMEARLLKMTGKPFKMYFEGILLILVV